MTVPSFRFAGLLLALLTLIGFDARAQIETRGTTAMGLAGGGPAAVQDNDALFLNPANLLHPYQRGRGVLTLGHARFFSGGDLYQFNHYNSTFTGGQQLTDAEILSVLDSWFGAKQRRAGAFFETVPLAFSYRSGNQAFGLGIRARTYSQVGLTRGLFDLVLRGTEETRDVPMDLSLRHASTVDVSVAYSRLFTVRDRRLTVGAAPKFVLGVEYMEADLVSTLHIEDDALAHTFTYAVRAAGGVSGGVVSEFSLFQNDPLANTSFSPSVAGKGAGIDLGATYEVQDDLLVSASLTDLGVISWGVETQTITPLGSEFRMDGLEIDRDRLRDEYDDSFGNYLEAHLDSLARDAYAEVDRENAHFASALPAAMHLGGAWYHGKATLTAGTSMGLNKAPGNLTRKPSLYGGAEYRLGGRYAVPVRAGFRVGGAGALTFGFGFGLHTPIYDFDLSIAATPKSDILGAGGRYMIGLSLGTFRF